MVWSNFAQDISCCNFCIVRILLGIYTLSGKLVHCVCWFLEGIVLFWFLEYSSFFLSHSELFYLGFLFVFIAKALGFWENLRMLSVDRTTCLQIYVDACISFQLDSFCFWIMRIQLQINVVTRKITPRCTVKIKGAGWFVAILLCINLLK